MNHKLAHWVLANAAAVLFALCVIRWLRYGAGDWMPLVAAINFGLCWWNVKLALQEGV